MWLRTAFVLMAMAPAALAEGTLPGALLPPPPAETARIGVTVFAGLQSNTGLPDRLRDGRAALHAGAPIIPAMLRDLADRRDGLAAQRLLNWLLTEAEDPSPSDIATYAAIAAGTGRTTSFDDFVAALYQLDPATESSERKRLYMAVLYPHAWAGNLLALDAVVDLNGPGRLFGELSDATRERILEADAAAGMGRAALRLAINLLAQPTRNDREEAQVDAYLTRAMAGADVMIRTIAANLLDARQPGAADGVLAR